jgi:hypothetical protein
MAWTLPKALRRLEAALVHTQYALRSAATARSSSRSTTSHSSTG